MGITLKWNKRTKVFLQFGFILGQMNCSGGRGISNQFIGYCCCTLQQLGFAAICKPMLWPTCYCMHRPSYLPYKTAWPLRSHREKFLMCYMLLKYWFKKNPSKWWHPLLESPPHGRRSVAWFGLAECLAGRGEGVVAAPWPPAPSQRAEKHPTAYRAGCNPGNYPGRHREEERASE